MLTSQHQYEAIPNDSHQSKDIPQGRVSEKPLRRIRKYPDFGGQPGRKGKLQALHPRFGPFYRQGQIMVSQQKDAWNKILEMSGDPNRTMEIYTSAMNDIGQKAWNAYEDSAFDTLVESEKKFRRMMIEDGCFFLHLALLILGVSPEQLGSSPNHVIFGQKPGKATIKRWIESMFFVGNQIPLVVLDELMKQEFFQNILRNHVNSKNVPSEVSKRILYEFVVLPAIEYSEQRTSPAPRKEFNRKSNSSKQRPSDLLHALHCLMFGEKAGESGPHIESKNGDDDLESGLDMESKDGESSPYTVSKANIESKDGKSGPSKESKDADDDLESSPNMKSRDNSLSAKELKKKGIRFGKLEQMGCREIKFKNRLLFARLYLPTFSVDDDTEALWKSLKDYEITQQRGIGNCEVSSYLQFMNDLICTCEDVRLLAEKGIIKGNSSCDKYELPKMLSKLAGKEKITTQNHRLLRTQLRDYGLAPWERLKTWAILMFILTAIQTVLAVLAYFGPTIQK